MKPGFILLCAVVATSLCVSCSGGNYPCLFAVHGPGPCAAKSPLARSAESLVLDGDQASGWSRTAPQKLLELLIIHPADIVNWGCEKEIGNQKSDYWVTEGDIRWKDGNNPASAAHRLHFVLDTKGQTLDSGGQKLPLTATPNFIILMKMNGSQRTIARTNSAEIAKLSKEEQQLIFEVFP